MFGIQRRGRLATLLASTAIAGIAAVALGACGSDAEPELDNPLDGGESFIAIDKDVDQDVLEQREGTLVQASYNGNRSGDEDFYLAVRRSALEGRWFMSTYLQQYFPGAIAGGAATSLGTRVIAFRIQNDRLYVLDAADVNATSDTFDPDLLIEAYPIVNNRRFGGFPGSRNYVLIDPSAGLNRFSAVSNAFAPAGSAQPVQFSIELSFLQRFRQLADGVSFDQVFTGYADEPITTDPTAPNAYQASGTLGVAFRRYQEGANFEKFPMPATPYYFEQGLLIPSGNPEQLAAKWDIYPGMEPIKWEISPALVDVAAAFPDLDLVEAVKKGITGWNESFGFEALTAEIADADAVFSDDDRNFLIVDPQVSFGFAFADYRTNPVTGEIRGASVFFDATWFENFFEDDFVARGHTRENALSPLEQPSMPSLLWNDTGTEHHLCARHVSSVQLAHAKRDAETNNLTASEKFANYITHVIAHEIGHTLGLRHNFKGSLLPPSSSVMEYVVSEDSARIPSPQAYDNEAIGYLYGLTPFEPSLPFCTDGDTRFDPDCLRFDVGAVPLDDDVGPFWQFVVTFFEQGFFLDDATFNLFVDFYAGPVLGYTRNGGPGQVNQAIGYLIGQSAAPQPAGLDPLVAEGRDKVLTAIITRLVSETSGDIVGPVSESLVPVLIDQATRVGINQDGIRSYESRRAVIDSLVELQRNEALAGLISIRDNLEAQIAGGLGPVDELLTEDLIARINEGTSPYFE